MGRNAVANASCREVPTFLCGLREAAHGVLKVVVLIVGCARRVGCVHKSEGVAQLMRPQCLAGPAATGAATVAQADVCTLVVIESACLVRIALSRLNSI